MNKSFGVLASSVDPSQLAATVQGIIISIASVIILLAGHYGLTLGNADVQTFAAQVGAIIGAGYALFGLIRKLVVWIAGKLANRGQNVQG